MNAYTLLFPANEKGYEQGLSYIDIIGARGLLFNEHDDCISAESIKFLFRALRSKHIDLNDRYYAQTVVFVGKLSSKASPKLVRETMSKFQESIGDIPNWFATVKNANTQIELLIPTRDLNGKNLVLSEPDLHLLATFAKAVSAKEAK
ncbi:MAG: hypothetical protein K2Y39_14385 [Candidatus Obscuribacterales bacterium]|nr:hypothetical protein [Candidatus Obscuribacterales bacterium]